VAARYQVPVNDAALAAQPWLGVPGLQFVSRDTRWGVSGEFWLCTFEDESAPPELAGRVVDLALSVTGFGAGLPAVRITSRTVIA
jgi:hypothetical protein